MSLLANAMIRDFPQYYKWFSVREFEHNGIKQQNRNGLLEKDPTVDGLKTGHTDSAGFCLVTSALRNGMRLVSVVMGSTSMKARENASAALLNYGFTFYETKLIVKGGSVLATAPVWKAAEPLGESRHQGRSLHDAASRRGRRRQDRHRCAAPADRAALPRMRVSALCECCPEARRSRRNRCIRCSRWPPEAGGAVSRHRSVVVRLRWPRRFPSAI